MALLNSKNFEQTERENEIDRLIEERFGFKDFDSFKKDLYEKIELAHKDIEEGRCQSLEDFCAEMEAKYHING